MLGAAMLLLGNGLLGNLNKEATSQESLGLAFWRIVISAGIIVIVMGVVNLFAVQLMTNLLHIQGLIYGRATFSATTRSV